jgi:hypothetical protein
MGVSENSVPLNPMVNDHYPYEMAIIGNIPYFQTNPMFAGMFCAMNGGSYPIPSGKHTKKRTGKSPCFNR